MNYTIYIRTNDENTLITVNKMGGAPPYTIQADVVSPHAFENTNTLKASAMQQVSERAKANHLRLREPGKVAVH